METMKRLWHSFEKSHELAFGLWNSRVVRFGLMSQTDKVIDGVVVEHRLTVLFILLEACSTFVGITVEKSINFEHICSSIKEKVSVPEGLKVFLDGFLAYADLLVSIKMKNQMLSVFAQLYLPVVTFLKSVDFLADVFLVDGGFDLCVEV